MDEYTVMRGSGKCKKSAGADRNGGPRLPIGAAGAAWYRREATRSKSSRPRLALRTPNGRTLPDRAPGPRRAAARATCADAVAQG